MSWTYTSCSAPGSVIMPSSQATPATSPASTRLCRESSSSLDSFAEAGGAACRAGRRAGQLRAIDAAQQHSRIATAHGQPVQLGDEGVAGDRAGDKAWPVPKLAIGADQCLSAG